MFNGSVTYQDVGIDISNMKFYTFIVGGCTNVDIILGTNSSNVLVDNYRLMVLMAAAGALYVRWSFIH